MSQMYFTEADTTDQNRLYAALVQQVEPILAAENDERQRLQAEFMEATKEQNAVYEASTLEAHSAAEQALKPLKEALDKRCKEIIDRHRKLIDKVVGEFGKKQAQLQREYDENTAPQRAAFEEATKAERAVLEQQLELLVDRVQANIKPINEEYRALAEALDQDINTANTNYLSPKEKGPFPRERAH